MIISLRIDKDLKILSPKMFQIMNNINRFTKETENGKFLLVKYYFIVILDQMVVQKHLNWSLKVMDMKNLIIKILKRKRVKDILLLLVQKDPKKEVSIKNILMMKKINMVNIFKL